uniref:Plasma membrane ascorbate-dependent reductase CYBRD1 n=1 Tax=Labrus bergylta TaxID=56723 RepID=A0A3Q3EPR2_9LABR
MLVPLHAHSGSVLHVPMGGIKGLRSQLNLWHTALILLRSPSLAGIIAFRLPWTHQLSKESVKLIHAALNTLAFFCAIMALKAVFGSQSGSNFPDLFSLHSWLVNVSVSVNEQIALAASIYLFPITPESWKAAFHPLHVFLGRFLFGSTICVSLIGLTERLIFSLNDPKYSDSPPEAFFANVMGLLLVAYGVAIFWISTNKSWKHPGPCRVVKFIILGPYILNYTVFHKIFEEIKKNTNRMIYFRKI